MKKLLAMTIAVVLGMSGTSVWAKNDNNKHETCANLAYAAYTITHLRQANVPLVEAKKDLKNIIDDDIAVNILNLAYSQPIGKTKEKKEKIAMDVAAQLYEACLKQ